MSDFDAIIVGSGCAGSAAAYALAKAGKSVLVVERGDEPGAKNVTGGRLYTHSLAKLFPDFATEAPLERKITHEKISFMTDASNFTIDFTSEKLAAEKSSSYSVLRSQFDPWLASKAEEAGAEYIPGIPVEELLKEGDRIIGIKAGEDELTAEVVILCDGANSLLLPQTGLGTMPKPSQMAVGVRQTFSLESSRIEDRFNLEKDEGAAWLFVGEPTGGKIGGGFLYTNKDTISVGLVATVSDLKGSKRSLPQLTEDFLHHSALTPVLKDAKSVEYSAHLIPEGGYDAMPELVGDGVMLAGDAAMMCLNFGYSVRGMDYAIAAGQMAGEAAAKALDAGDTTAAGLAGYRTALENSFVLKDMKSIRRMPKFMEDTPRMFETYPNLVEDIAMKVFAVDGSPVQPMKKNLLKSVKDSGGLIALAKDGLRASKAL